MSKEQEKFKKQDLNIDSTEHSLDESNDFYDGFSPLDEPVKERSYTKANIDASNLEADLEEPSFEAPSFDDFEDVSNDEPKTFNPAMETLDKKEQMYATEQMVDTVLDVYGKAHILANKATRIKEEKIATAMQEGEIDPSLRVPIDDMGNSLGLLEYIQEYNNQLSDAIKLEDEFVEKVRPPMIRVFQKKGLAMTDEQFLMVAFGTDIVTKGAMIFQLVRQNNRLFAMWKEQSNFIPKQPANKKQPKASQSSPSEPSPNEPSPSEPNIKRSEKTQEFQEPEEFTAESMVKDMMGMREEVSFKNAPQPDGMPTFGDPDMLSKLDRLAKNESKVIDITPKNDKSQKRRGRPKKN